MTRGGARKERDEPERRCIATGARAPAAGLVRFVRDPEGRAVPDLAGKLPGRGVWVTSERAALERAVAKRLFSRGFKAPTEAPADLPERVAALLAERLVAAIAMGRKAGEAVTGFEKTRFALQSGDAAVLLQAADGAADGRGKLRRLARAMEIPAVELLSARELGLAFGRDFAIHAALLRGGVAGRALSEAERLRGFRAPDLETSDPGAPDGAAPRERSPRASGPEPAPTDGRARPGASTDTEEAEPLAGSRRDGG